ncbi:MAG TPA: secondary thiamine-phosphate synthase enzyme YjbQ [bacterium]|nr:secondary thiamine-phosphate synthase enzyme YjbQ [bacterium]HOL34356.1 secondary thiamine-phosphate synthase enzyme YjbQ [bacterium]HPP07493.1 secondary thiamine-phosphate synthase enzyme YjbQ [bacterium]
MIKIQVRTAKRKEMIDITQIISDVVKKNSVNSGICMVFVPHTTCGLTINENADPSVQADILSSTKRLVPENATYSHLEGNSDAHIQSTLVGHSILLIIEKGTIQLGTWQGVFLCEFDGPRTREVWIQILK